MSALEEYRKFEVLLRFGSHVTQQDVDAVAEGVRLLQDKADAAIAELEADTTRLFDEAQRCRARIAELEAENVRQKATIEAQSAIIKQADEALAARERMLRLAWTETVQAESYYWKYHDNVDEWLADLRARAEEGRES